MSERNRLIEQLDRVFRGDPWYGDSVMAVLADVSAAEARARPVPAAHSIWELVLHMTGWKAEVRARLQGAPAGMPAAGDWPVVPDSEAAWPGTLAALASAHSGLIAALEAATDAELDLPVREERNQALGMGLSRWQTVRGVLQHDIYHLGQISLLKRAIRG